MEYQAIAGRLVQGYRLASGLNGNPRVPGGTLRMQMPHFLALGLDLSALYPGTLNVTIATLRYRMLRPRHTFHAVKWHPIEPAEDFSFADCRLAVVDAPAIAGFIYYPHPDTKPEHLQKPDVLELLLPFVEGLCYVMEISLEIPSAQMVIESRPTVPYKHLRKTIAI